MDRQRVTDFQGHYDALKEEAHCQIMPISAREGDNLEVMVELIKEIVEKERNLAELEQSKSAIGEDE